MGACLGKSLEVVAVHEVQALIVPFVLEEVRTKLIPQVIQALQMTEKELDSIAAAQNKSESNIRDELHSSTAV